MRQEWYAQAAKQLDESQAGRQRRVEEARQATIAMPTSAAARRDARPYVETLQRGDIGDHPAEQVAAAIPQQAGGRQRLQRLVEPGA